MSKMSLEIENIGPINRADLNLGKLNIVGGINGSGKSTATKLLYSFLLASSFEGHKLYEDALKFELKSIGVFLQNAINYDEKTGEFNEYSFEIPYGLFDEISDIVEDIISMRSREVEYNFEKIIKNWIDFVNFLDIEVWEFNSREFYINYIENMLEAYKNQKELYKFHVLLKYIFYKEFGYYMDINPYGKGKATFKKQSDSSSWTLHVGSDGLRENIENYDYMSDFEGDVIYIDSISPLDVMHLIFSKPYSYHIDALYPKLGEDFFSRVFGEVDEKTLKFIEKVDELIGGKFAQKETGRRRANTLWFDEYANNFLFKKKDDIFAMINSSSGLKQIGIIQMLLFSNILKENDFLIIDEPEVNLHPEWQVRLAEIIVLLVKDLNITIYLNSHSPHFIEALEVFSVKHGIKDETRFFMTGESEIEDKFDFKQLDYSTIQELYTNLGNPYNEINRIRLQNSMKGL